MDVRNFPYVLYGLPEPSPVFPHLEGAPYLCDLAAGSALLADYDPSDPPALERKIRKEMGSGFSWGLSAYLEDRRTLLAGCGQMTAEGRFHHLGLDVIVDKGVALHSPLDAIVEDSGYEEGNGNYGGYVLLRHEGASEPFYSMYGHLAVGSLPETGVRLDAGAPFASTGDFHENGNWFFHTHLQILTRRGLDAGYQFKGYCTFGDLPAMPGLCPSPVPLFRVHGKD